MAEIINLKTELIIRTIASQTEYTEENSNLREGVEECIERNKVYQMIERAKSKERADKGLEPNPCFNAVCDKHVDSSQNATRFNYCEDESDCHGCLFQMLTPPPNHLNYNEYMPSHREALDMLEKHGLLKGDRQVWADVFEDYKKCKSQSDRANVKLDGVSIHQAGKALGVVLSGLRDYFANVESDLESASFLDDEMQLIIRNFEVELEKVLGVYPNIQLVR